VIEFSRAGSQVKRFWGWGAVENVGGTDHLRQVRKYYDHNTGRFLKWGKGESTFNLHGALWHPEVKSLAGAMHYSNELVAREIERCPYPVNRVLDLGCGVGGSIFYLVRRLSRVRSFTGISLSPLQIDTARQRIPEAQKNRIHFEEGSFLQLPTDRFKTDFSYSIEAFTHCSDPDIFFAVQADLLAPGGRLAIVDDCLSDEIGPVVPANADTGQLPPQLAVAGFARFDCPAIPCRRKRLPPHQEPKLDAVFAPWPAARQGDFLAGKISWPF
jgi:SAM-dependent methyltransferase